MRERSWSSAVRPFSAYPDAPDELLASMEADVFPKDCPANSILIEGAIGERSIFHETFG